MKIIFTILTSYILLTTASAYGVAGHSDSKEFAKIKIEAENFYLNQSKNSYEPTVARLILASAVYTKANNNCDDNEGPRRRVSCVKTLCSKRDCGYAPYAKEIASWCRGSNGSCVKALCSKRDCGYAPYAKEIASSCKGSNGLCVKTLCSKRDCGYAPYAKEIASSCKGSDGECVKELCSKRDCGYAPYAKEIARVCAGD